MTNHGLKKNIGGLQPTPEDKRDFTVGALFRLPTPTELPQDFDLGVLSIKDQTAKSHTHDFCSAFIVAGMSELQEDEELWPDFNFAASKEISKDNEAWGQNLRDAMKSAVTYGSVPQKNAVKVKKPRYLSSYPRELLEIAKKYKKQTFLNVQPTNGMDAFDTMRATMYRFRDEKRAIGLGVVFGWNLSDKIINTIPTNGYGHALYTVGWKTINGEVYLKVVQSAGPSAGENGVHYFSRAVINYYYNHYKAFMFVDMPRENVEYMLDNGIKTEDNWIIQLLKVIKTIVLSPFFTNEEKDILLDATSEVVEEKIEEAKPITPREELYQEAVKWLGKDASPKQLAPDDLACAESVSNIIAQITPWPTITGTWTLNAQLNLSPKFEKVGVKDVQSGDVLVYPTGELKAPFVGHAFICGKDGKLMSNTSATGKWEENYTLATARARWEGVGYNPHFYRLKSK